MPYLHRTIEPLIERASRRFKVVMLSGMRQVGKTTLFEHLCENRKKVTLDDLRTLQLALDAPERFFSKYPAPAFVDEIQTVPQLFLPLKLAVDSCDAKGQYWISGSQRLHLMDHVADKLPGRLLPLDLMPLSIYERQGLGLEQKPYIPSQDRLTSPSPVKTRSAGDIWSMIYKGAWPAALEDNDEERDLFYHSLTDLYIRKDVAALCGVEKSHDFMRFIRMLAARTGQELRVNSLAQETGVAVATVKRWLSIAEASGVIYFLRPWFSNVNKRLVKSSKMYLADTGLAAWLLGLHSARELECSAFAGSLFETFVVTEILKSWVHNGKTPNFFFMRTPQGLEVDLLIEDGGLMHAVEIKSHERADRRDAKWIRTLSGQGLKMGTSAVINLIAEPTMIAEDIIVHGVWDI